MTGRRGTPPSITNTMIHMITRTDILTIIHTETRTGTTIPSGMGIPTPIITHTLIPIIMSSPTPMAALMMKSAPFSG